MESSVDVRGNALLLRFELDLGPAFAVAQCLIRGFCKIVRKLSKNVDGGIEPT